MSDPLIEGQPMILVRLLERDGGRVLDARGYFFGSEVARFGVPIADGVDIRGDVELVAGRAVDAVIAYAKARE